MNARQLSDLLTSLVRGEQGSCQEGGNGNNTGVKAISQVKEAQDDDYIITYTEVFLLGFESATSLAVQAVQAVQAVLTG